MKIIKAIAKDLRKGLMQNDSVYDFSFDVAQKITFVLTILILWGIRIDMVETGFEYGIYICCCILGRLLVMTGLKALIDRYLEAKGGRKSPYYFLRMPPFVWRIIVLVFVAYITIKDMVQPRSVEDFLITSPAWVVMSFVGFCIFALRTEVGGQTPDPTKVGSPAWREENGIEKVNSSLTRPLYRDKNGNYYGYGWVPVPTPVEIVEKEK